MTSERKFVPEQKEVEHKKVAQVCVYFCLGECVAGVSKEEYGTITHYVTIMRVHCVCVCVCVRVIFSPLCRPYRGALIQKP